MLTINNFFNQQRCIHMVLEIPKPKHNKVKTTYRFLKPTYRFLNSMYRVISLNQASNIYHTWHRKTTTNYLAQNQNLYCSHQHVSHQNITLLYSHLT